MYQEITIQPNWNYLSQESIDEINKKSICNSMMACKDIAVADAKNQIVKRSAEEQFRRSEQIKEQKKSQYEEIEIDVEGAVTMITKNSCVPVKPRVLTNLKNPIVYMYQSDTEPGKKIYLLMGKVNGEIQYVCLDGAKTGRPGYLLAKLREMGGYIKVDQASTERMYILQFWAFLLRERMEGAMLPLRCGWFKTCDYEISFCKKEDLSWERIKQEAGC